MLWRIAFFVEGKHLEKCLAAVTGIALNMEPPKPVINAVVKASKVEPISSTASTKQDHLTEWLKAQKGNELTTDAIKNKYEELGGSRTSVGGVLTGLIEQKAIKRRKQGLYFVP